MYDEAFIFIAPGAEDRVVREHSGGRTVFAFVPDGAAAARVAGELADGGVRLVELYRGFDLTATARVIEAVGGRAPVAAAGTLAPAARSWATIYADPSADPADRVVQEHADGGRTTILGVADDAEAERVARELVDGGVEVIEFCGGSPLTRAAAAKRAVGDRATVGVVSWPFESIDGVAAFKAAYEEKMA